MRVVGGIGFDGSKPRRFTSSRGKSGCGLEEPLNHASTVFRFGFFIVRVHVGLRLLEALAIPMSRCFREFAVK